MTETRQEEGIILILLAVLVTVLLAFAALVIDLTLYANWREQAQHYARLASLAALEAHLQDATANPSNTPSQNYTAALTRASFITGENFTLTDKDQAHPGELKAPAGTGDGAELIPGRWFFTMPDDGTDPCGGAANYPCFQAVDLSQANPPPITAYRINGTLIGGLSTKFAGFAFGVDSFDTPVFATATLVPRRGCFLVDLSASMTRETHLDAFSANSDADPLTQGSDFAYYLAGDRPGGSTESTTTSNNRWTSFTGDPDYAARPTNQSGWENSTNGFLDSLVPSRTFSSPTTLSNDLYQSFHFVNDYVRMKTLGDADYANYPDNDLHPDPAGPTPAGVSYDVVPGAATAGRFIRVDRFRKTSPTFDGSPSQYTYNGPEPLRTVFQGLSTAFQAFQDRQVAGDSACLIMYDSSFAWPRFVRMTDDFNYLKALVDFDNMSGMPGSDEPAGIDAIADLGVGFKRIVRHGLLPIGEGGNSTNTQLAITEAMRELASNTGAAGFSSNFVVVMSDGLNNCYPNPGGGSYVCSNDYASYESSKAALQDYVADTIQGTNIPVHWIMFGRQVQPHTLRIPDGSGGCLSEETARATNQSLVLHPRSDNQTTLANAFNNMSSSTPFYEANSVPYEIVVGTRGLWGPIRPKATGCNPSNPPPCTTSGTNPELQATDPLCRTPQQQIDAYMAKILGDNPFTLVEAQ